MTQRRVRSTCDLILSSVPLTARKAPFEGVGVGSCVEKGVGSGFGEFGGAGVGMRLGYGVGLGSRLSRGWRCGHRRWQGGRRWRRQRLCVKARAGSGAGSGVGSRLGSSGSRKVGGGVGSGEGKLGSLLELTKKSALTWAHSSASASELALATMRVLAMVGRLAPGSGLGSAPSLGAACAEARVLG